MMREQLKKAAKAFEHPFVVLLLGALITYGIGEQIRSSFQTRHAKGNFSLRVVQLAFNRLFWTRLYVERTRVHLPKEDLDYAWSKYIESLEAWNTDLMSNLQLFDRYYPGENKRDTFEREIHSQFRKFHDALLSLRYPGTPPGNEELDAKVKELSRQIDEFNITLGQFASGLEMEFMK
jgi:hypothetical protein